MSACAAPGFAPGPAHPEELAAVADLAAVAFPGGPGRADLEAALAAATGRLHVARRGREIAGFALARRVVDELEIAWIAVGAPHRRRGVGARLLADLIVRERAAAPLSAVHLEVRAGNEAALAFYAAAGFVAVGRRERYYRGGEDAIRMTRTL
ncbi:MAG: GNAT family N-acetyltransferase [Myxococcota bacterium]|nr:GNAT family N-acetyltransferase [Myxococcota bacterium]